MELQRKASKRKTNQTDSHREKQRKPLSHDTIPTLLD